MKDYHIYIFYSEEDGGQIAPVALRRGRNP
jgi:hypothetical protein